MKIKPQVGLEDVHFGMTRERVLELRGEPDHASLTHHEDGSSTESWYYTEPSVAFHFEEECEWRLKYMESSSPEANLKGEKVIGFSPQQLRRHLRRKRVLWGEEEADDVLFYCQAWDMNFWFKGKSLESIQWEVGLDDHDNYRWP